MGLLRAEFTTRAFAPDALEWYAIAHLVTTRGSAGARGEESEKSSLRLFYPRDRACPPWLFFTDTLLKSDLKKGESSPHCEPSLLARSIIKSATFLLCDKPTSISLR